jgi:hypothetical protein
MAERKVVPFDGFYYQLKLMYLFQKHPVCICTGMYMYVELVLPVSKPSTSLPCVVQNAASKMFLLDGIYKP